MEFCIAIKKQLLLLVFIPYCQLIAAQDKVDYTALIKQQEAIEAQKQAAIPKENIAKHVQAITTSAAVITALANTNKTTAFARLDAVAKQQLASLITSTKNSLADIGMMLFIQGPHGKNTVLYLVSSAIIKNPKDTAVVQA